MLAATWARGQRAESGGRMKLWQKIFLLTLTLVIIVVNITSLALLSTNHRLAIEREQQNALSRHRYLIAEMQNYIINTQLMEQTAVLSDNETLAVAKDVLKRRANDIALQPSLFSDGQLVYSSPGTPYDAELELLAQPDYSSVIIDDNNRTFLLIVSTTLLNERAYQLVSSTDISSTYDLFKAGFDQVRIIGIVSALVIAGFLQMLVRGLLIPLRDLSGTTRKIARGDLENRATVTGHDEVADVARDFNTMADSIEHNVTELEKLAESRQVFIGNLAHEMKTPLTSILGFADILRVKREVTDEDRINYANVIVSETKRLQGLSSKLMDLLTLGNLHLSPVAIDVRALFEELETTLQPIMKSHEITLEVCFLEEEGAQGTAPGAQRRESRQDSPGPDERALIGSSPQDIRINGDVEMIKSLVFNLIDNSIKASKPGSSIQLSAMRGAAGGAHDGQVVLTVTDHGIGIPQSQIPQLTEPFFMLDKARTRKHGGAGLGLALCAEIAKAHGGQLQITSKLDEGTSVSVALPAALPAAQER